ncbi:hypothetical protein C8Q76DRAFT_212878 [Earliella scabrosa]|nr:hypothetical protein C8Q76DRAFT_212878 [Earliella scabrosa]
MLPMAYVTATCRLRKTSPMSVALRARRKCSDLMLRHARTTRPCEMSVSGTVLDMAMCHSLWFGTNTPPHGQEGEGLLLGEPLCLLCRRRHSSAASLTLLPLSLPRWPPSPVRAKAAQAHATTAGGRWHLCTLRSVWQHNNQTGDIDALPDSGWLHAQLGPQVDQCCISLELLARVGVGVRRERELNLEGRPTSGPRSRGRSLYGTRSCFRYRVGDCGRATQHHSAPRDQHRCCSKRMILLLCCEGQSRGY